MALVKTVELRILANAGDAQAKLDEITAKADKLKGDAIRLRFRVDDADGMAHLDKIQARAKELGLKDVVVRVRVDGAGKAIAELNAVRDASRDGSFLSRLFGGGGGGGILGLVGRFGGGALGPIPLPAGAAGLGVGVGAIAAALGTAPIIDALLSGGAAAGAGALSFGIMSRYAWQNVQQLYGQQQTAQTGLANAQALYQVDPTRANAQGLTRAADQLKAVNLQIQQLGPAAQGAITAWGNLVAAGGKLQTAFQPTAMKVFNEGLKALGSLMPAVLPFAQTFGNVLAGLLAKVNTFAQSKGFQQWLGQFHALEGPALTAIGTGIGQVANSIGKVLTVMSAKDVSQSISAIFKGIAAVIGALPPVIRGVMTAWHDLQNAAETAAKFVVSSWKGAVSFIQGIPGKIKGDFADAGSWLLGAGRAIIGGLISGIKGAAEGGLHAVLSWVKSLIPAWKGPISADLQLLVPAGVAIMQGLINGLASGFPALHSLIGRVAGMIRGGIHGTLYPGVVNLGPEYQNAVKFSPGGGVPYGPPGGSGRGDTYIINVHTLQASQDVARAVVQMLKEYKRHGGGGPLGIS